MSSLCLRLFALGEKFDVDAYLANAPLQFNEVWRVGDYVCGGGVIQSNGVEIYLDEGNRTLVQQDRIAVEFISTHREALRELGAFSGVEAFILGLYLNIPAGFWGTVASLSFELTRYSLDLGIELKLYIDREWDEFNSKQKFVNGRKVDRFRRRLRAERRR
jgi:hypothetical protein